MCVCMHVYGTNSHEPCTMVDTCRHVAEPFLNDFLHTFSHIDRRSALSCVRGFSYTP